MILKIKFIATIYWASAMSQLLCQVLHIKSWILISVLQNGYYRIKKEIQIYCDFALGHLVSSGVRIPTQVSLILEPLFFLLYYVLLFFINCLCPLVLYYVLLFFINCLCPLAWSRVLYIMESLAKWCWLILELFSFVLANDLLPLTPGHLPPIWYLMSGPDINEDFLTAFWAG